MEPELIRRRHLPHWDVPGAAFFITACLDASIPAQGLLDLSRHEKELRSHARSAGMEEDAWRAHLWKQLFVRREHWLDHEPANRALEQHDLARAVVHAMDYFAGERYDLFAYVVMPSHLHWLFRPRPEWTATLDIRTRTARERIMYSLKRYTATVCNRLLRARGAFWQQESYDHWVRDGDEMERIIRYIEQNPVKAGLVKAPEDWEFSSAWARGRAHLELGAPLTKGVSGLES